MTNVTLSIGGRSYTVACAAGEEAHVGKLGLLIDSTLEAMPNGIAHSETRSLLFAALLLADELHELRNTSAAAAAPPASPILDAPLLDAIAIRLERLADVLDQPV